MTYFEELKNIVYWNNSLYDYLLALIVLIIAIVVLKIFQVVVLSRLKKLSQKTENKIDDIMIEVFSSVRPPLYLVVGLYLSFKMIALPELVVKVINILFLIIVVYEIVRALQKIIDFIIKQAISNNKGKSKDKKYSESMLRALSMIIKIVLWVIAIVLVLSNLGVDVTSLVASLGIGGIAIALALQGVLGDMFSSFSIYIDKPFQIGDYITAGTDSGTVEKIGLKTTRLKTLQGEELVIANQELTTARISNFKKMEKRRVVANLGVVYDSKLEQLKSIPQIIKQIVEAGDKLEFGRCHFKSFEASSLNFELVYYVDSQDYEIYMNEQEKINLAIFEEFAKQNIEFAFPTQTINLQKN